MNGTNCSDPSAEFQYHLFPAVYILALVVGLPGNVAAFLVFIRTSPRTAFSVYISNLALADILILCTLPLRIHYHLHRNHWVFGDFTCLVTGTLYFSNIYLSICFMTCICLDRYMATVHPHPYLKLQSPRLSLGVSALLWATAGAAALVFILMGPLEIGDASLGHRCFESFARTEWEKRLGPFSIVSLLFSLVPTLVLLVCYTLVARRVARIKVRQARKAVRVIHTILLITALCFLPNHVVYLLHLLQRLDVIQSCSARHAIYRARRVTMALVTLNTCLDPVLYYMTTSHFRWDRLKRSWLWGMVNRSRGVYSITGQRE
ncbi:lysophosphatidic acid receptor 6 [Cololabis saira]|uniref:lysophosphatidic acid receptor 6 n=1 Tax=Cololabis saira TaxID=129043 RepID=UPI002AD45C3F|nr:lysophosphatidic acid receptor 6 [Cololabis saira]